MGQKIKQRINMKIMDQMKSTLEDEGLKQKLGEKYDEMKRN